MTTHYEALEVAQDAVLGDIRKQFQTLSLLVRTPHTCEKLLVCLRCVHSCVGADASGCTAFVRYLQTGSMILSANWIDDAMATHAAHTLLRISRVFSHAT